MEEFVKQNPLALVQFGEEACGPCRAIRSRVEAWTEKNPPVRFLYLDLETHRKTASQLGIFAVPTLILYVEGKPAIQCSGCFSLQEFLGKTRRYAEFFR